MNAKPKTKTKSKDLSLEADLETALDFTPADLEANRDGQLSKNQRIKLRNERSKTLTAFMPISLIILVVVLLFFQRRAQEIPGWWVALVVGILVIAPLYRVVRVTLDLRGNHIEAIQGYIRLDMNSSQCTLTLGDQSWQVNKAVFLAFKNGDPYCLYYTPHSRTLLSAEWLREA